VNVVIAIVVAFAFFITIRNLAMSMKSKSAERQKISAMSSVELAEFKANEQRLRERLEGAHADWTAGAEALKSQNEALRLQKRYGPLNQQIICPHCQYRGKVRTKSVKRKTGISGSKATAAMWTMGWSTLATGLSRKVALTQAHCENCNSTWSF
jgi:hypothetical protein